MAEQVEQLSQHFEVVEKWLRKQGASFTSRTASTFNAEFKFPKFTASAFIVPLATGVVMIFKTDIVADKTQYNELLSISNQLNDRVPFGNFEVTHEGRLNFKVSTFLDSSESSTFKSLSQCLGSAAAMLIGYVPSISAWLKGDLKFESVLTHAEENWS